MSKGNKNAILVEANVMNTSAKFQLYPSYGLFWDDFLNFFSKFNQIQNVGQKWYVW